MKTKEIKKKLFLNKKTIAHLANGQLGHAKGGGQTTSCPYETCDTCGTCDCVPTGQDPTQDCSGDTCNTCHKLCDTRLCAVSNTCPEMCLQ